MRRNLKMETTSEIIGDSDPRAHAGDSFELSCPVEKKPRLETATTIKRADSVFENIKDSTKELINSDNSNIHVSTFAGRRAAKFLSEFGSICIIGRSGCGKSRLGRRLLAGAARDSERTPVIISSAYQWNFIPKFNREEFVVMIDDIFGSSNLVQSHVDEWLRQFDLMWPSVESGHIFLVITSRPEIFVQCQNKVKRYKLIRQMKTITLDEGKYVLKDTEKQKFLRNLCGRKQLDLTESDVREISQIETPLGFPQCCEFFAANKSARLKGPQFFLKPYSHLQSVLKDLKESDALGFVVLTLLMMKQGYLKHKVLRPLSPESSEFNHLVQELTKTCYLPSSPGYGQIKSKAEFLCGVYLTRSREAYQFQHQSIFDAVFLEVAEEYPEMCVRVCSPNMLVELVRTERCCSEDHEVVIHLEEDMHDVLAERITELILSTECDVLSHPALNDYTFIQRMISKFKDIGLDHFLVTQVEPVTVSYLRFDNFPRALYMDENILFECNNLLSMILLKCTPVFAEAVVIDLFQGNYPMDTIVQVLSCAINRGISGLVNLLLDKGVVPDESCFRAMCASRTLHFTVVERILSLIHEDVLQEFRDISDMFCLAVLNGHNFPIRPLIRVMQKYNNHEIVLSKSIHGIFDELRCRHIYEQSKCDVSEQLLKEAVDLLLQNLPQLNTYESLVEMSACHNNSVALRAILQKGLKLETLEWLDCLKAAIRFGHPDCISEILKFECEDAAKEFGENAGLLLCSSSESVFESTNKVKLLQRFILENYSQEQIENLVESSNQPLANKEDNVGNTALHSATKQGDTATSLLEDGACVNAQNEKGDTCSNNHLVNIKDFAENTALHSAAKQGNIDTVAYLLKDGACVNAENIKGDTPLYMAVSRNHFECVKLLLKAKSEVNKFKSEKRSVVLQAANIAMLKELVAAGSNLNVVDNEQRSCLHLAAERDDIESVTFLCNRGYKVNAKNAKAETPILLAARYGNLNMMELLNANGADLDVRNLNGETIVHRIVKSDNEVMEKLKFIALHVSLHTTDYFGRTVLFPATVKGDLEVVEFLTAKGLDLKERDGEGNTFLHAVFERGNFPNIETVTMLLDAGIDADLQGSGENTALHLALRYDDLKDAFEIRKLIIDKLKDVNYPDSSGRLTLHLAAKYDAHECVKLLLAKGANRDRKDNFGCIATDYAGRYPHSKDCFETSVEKM